MITAGDGSACRPTSAAQSPRVVVTIRSSIQEQRLTMVTGVVAARPSATSAADQRATWSTPM
jgi:hypothetical protein